MKDYSIEDFLEANSPQVPGSVGSPSSTSRAQSKPVTRGFVRLGWVLVIVGFSIATAGIRPWLTWLGVALGILSLIVTLLLGANSD